jgi:uncharacterized repeat protein (TIGR01451 family)
VAISDAPDPVAAGSALTYIVQVTNNGPSTSTGMTVVDVLQKNGAVKNPYFGKAMPTCGEKKKVG